MLIRFNATTKHIEMYITGGNVEDYPKSYKVKNNTSYYPDGRSEDRIGIYADLQPDKINKGQNEGGLLRIKKFVNKATQVYGNVEFERISNYGNNIDLPEVIFSK